MRRMNLPDHQMLLDFYTHPLGAVVARKVRARVQQFWPELFPCNMPHPPTILGMGYTLPFLRPLYDQANRRHCHVMELLPEMVQQGENMPRGALIASPAQLPLPDHSVEYILMSHLLEFTTDPSMVLEEVWRVLRPEGKLLMIVPNRLSLWARVERTPFGHGLPYTPRQLEQLLEASFFERYRLEMALFLPPTETRWVLKSAQWFHRIGRFFFEPLGGVLLMEAHKRTLAMIPDFQKRRRGFAVAANGSEVMGRKQV